jgi:hypothetical protein
MLMDAGLDVVGDTNPMPGHPLRQIADWVQGAEPGSPEVGRRRSAVLNAVQQWLRDGKDAKVAVKVGASALSPHYESSELDPGSGRVVTYTRNMIGLGQLDEIRTLWTRFVSLLSSLDVPDFEPIQQAISQYVFPYAAGVTMSDEYVEACQEVAVGMIRDLQELAKGCSGVMTHVRQWAGSLGIDVSVEVDPDYEVLFPCEALGDDWREQQRKQYEAATALAERWVELSPADVARRLVQAHGRRGHSEHQQSGEEHRRLSVACSSRR